MVILNVNDSTTESILLSKPAKVEPQMSADPIHSDETVRMPSRSKYEGKPVDESSRRSLRLIQPQETQQDSETELVVADYFYHAGSFWRAHIPIDAVDQVSGQVFNFSKPKMKPGTNGPEIVFGKDGLPRRTLPALNHVQSRFRLRPGQAIKLYPMNDVDSHKVAHEIDDFIYSIEAVGPLGVKFNLKDAMLGNLLSAHRFLSTEEMVFERLVVESQYLVESPPLPISEPEKRELLKRSLLRSHAAGMQDVYYLFRICGTNNCTSSPFQILDGVVEYSLTQRLGSYLYRLPLNPRLYLRIRGLDSDSGFRRFVRDEFQEYINHRETQQRKRSYVRQRVKAARAARDAGKAAT